MDKKYEVIFGENIKRLLDERGLTQLDLAVGIGVAPATISMYCKGQRMPRLDGVQDIANFLHVDWSELIETDEERRERIKTTRFAEYFEELDDSGKELVTFVLMHEYTRCHTNTMREARWFS